jgi:hypothetical protein
MVLSIMDMSFFVSSLNVNVQNVGAVKHEPHNTDTYVTKQNKNFYEGVSRTLLFYYENASNCT